MTSQRTSICIALFCVAAFAESLWAARPPESDPGLSNREITKALDAGNYAKASEDLHKLLSQNPKDAQATLRLARCYWDLGDYDQAVNYAERAVNLAPKCAECHLWLGRAYGLKADKSRSILLARKCREEFQTAVRLDPNNLFARRDLMEFYLEAPWFLGGSKEKAWAQVEDIASRDHVEGHLVRADYWREVDQPLRAAQEYQEVLKLRPKHVEPYFQVADFYESKGNAEQLEAVVHAASLIGPNDPRLAYYRGVARVLDGRQLAEAEQYFKEYLSRAPWREDFPPHAAAHDWLGRIYERWGKMQDAIQQYKAALHLSPDNQTAQDRLHRLESN